MRALLSPVALSLMGDLNNSNIDVLEAYADAALERWLGWLEDAEPVAIYDVADDPRIQYPNEAIKEGIASILSVPIIIGEKLIGCMRVYTAEPWEFTLNDVNFVQAVAQVVGMGLEMCRVNKGLKDSIDILKTMRDPRTLKSKRRTPYEGIPKSFANKEIPQTGA